MKEIAEPGVHLDRAGSSTKSYQCWACEARIVRLGSAGYTPPFLHRLVVIDQAAVSCNRSRETNYPAALHKHDPTKAGGGTPHWGSVLQTTLEVDVRGRPRVEIPALYPLHVG